jgi:hypothetical protein
LYYILDLAFVLIYPIIMGGDPCPKRKQVPWQIL